MSEPTEQETYRRGVDERFDRQDEALDRIEAQGRETLKQAKYTNGRVNQLELDRAISQAQLRLIRNLLYAVAAGLAFLIGQVAVPIIGSLVQAGKI